MKHIMQLTHTSGAISVVSPALKAIDVLAQGSDKVT